METIKACPSCYHPHATWVHYPNGESPDEVHCDDCGFDWQASRNSGSPYGDAEEHRLNRQALEEEEEHAAAIDAAYEESQNRISSKVQFNKICRNTDPSNVFAFLDYVQDKHHG